MKVGDRLYCHKDFKEFVKGSIYFVVSITDAGNLMIGNENLHRHWFYSEGVKRYFYTEQENRKLKLEKLNEIRDTGYPI